MTLNQIKADKNLKYSDILCLSETWLQNKDDIKKYTSQDYTKILLICYKSMCHLQHIQGLLMCVLKNMQIMKKQKYPNITFEAIKAYVLKAGMPFTEIGIYKAPRMTLQELRNETESHYKT